MSAATTRTPSRARLLARLARAHVNLTVHAASVEGIAKDEPSLAVPLRAILGARDALACVYFFAADDPREAALAGESALPWVMLSLYAACAQALVAMRQFAFARTGDATRAVLLDARLAAAAHTAYVDVGAARAEISPANAPASHEHAPAHFTRAASELVDVAIAFPHALRL